MKPLNEMLREIVQLDDRNAEHAAQPLVNLGFFKELRDERKRYLKGFLEACRQRTKGVGRT